MKVIKRVVYFCWGIILGFIYHELLVQKIGFPRIFRIPIVLFIFIFLAFGNAFSMKFRCISFLILPSLCSKIGKNIIQTIIFIYLSEGPIHNIGKNMIDIVNKIQCGTELTYNLTEERINLMVQPYIEALLKLNDTSEDTNDVMCSVNKLVEVLNNEIYRQTFEIPVLNNSTSKIHNQSASDNNSNYKKKMEKKCKKQINKGLLNFINKYNPLSETFYIIRKR